MGFEIGDEVEFVAEWSSFCGQTGHVSAVKPRLMVVLDDDARPIAVGHHEVRRTSKPGPWGAGE